MSQPLLFKGIWILVIAFALNLLYWFFLPSEPHALTTAVSRIAEVPFFEGKWAYAVLMLLCFVPVFALSFDKRVHYHTHWKYLWRPILFIALPFTIWDIIKTVKGVWGFSSAYTLGPKIFSLPLEEWSFFLIVPFCCLFIHACLAYYFPKDIFKSIEPLLSWGFFLLFAFMSVFYFDKTYTFSNFFLCAAFQLWHNLYGKAQQRSRFYLTFLVSLFPFLLVNGVLTGAITATPIVQYNPLEHHGFRWVTIPWEDTFYGYLLLFSVVVLYEWEKENKFGMRKE